MLTTKVRENDWASIQKAVRQLEASIGKNSSPEFNTITVTNNINAGGSQVTNFAIQRVADLTALYALEFYLARMAFVDSEGVLFLASDY